MTLTFLALATWAFVTIVPSAEAIRPDPRPPRVTTCTVERRRRAAIAESSASRAFTLIALGSGIDDSLVFRPRPSTVKVDRYMVSVGYGHPDMVICSHNFLKR